MTKLTLVDSHFICEQNPFSRINKSGYINLSTAQNYLMWLPLSKKLKLNGYLGINKKYIHYGELQGEPNLRGYIANNYYNGHSNNCIISASIWSIIEMIIFELCSTGKHVLVFHSELTLYSEFDIIERRTNTKINIIRVSNCSQIPNYLKENNTSVIFSFLTSEKNSKKILDLIEEKNIYYVQCVKDISCFNNTNSPFMLFVIDLNTSSRYNSSFAIGLGHEFIIQKIYDQAINSPVSRLSQANLLHFLKSQDKISQLPNKHDANLIKDLLKKRLTKVMSTFAKNVIYPRNIVIGSGATPLLECFGFILCKKGDSILIPTPYYAGFDHIFCNRVKAKIIKIETPQCKGKVSVACLKKYINSSIKCAVICSPVNPTGVVYTREEIIELAAFAEEQKLHIIFDEMYANSVFPEILFYSALNIKSEYVHVVWGLAKDLGLSGFKIGIAHTYSKVIKSNLEKQSFIFPVATDTLKLVLDIILDYKFILSIFEENKQKIKKSYTFLTKYLQKYNIEYCEPQSGIFVFINLSPFLKEKSIQGEMNLYRKFLNSSKLNISPGHLFHAPEPGWFRICYAVNQQMLNEGIKRLIKTLAL